MDNIFRKRYKEEYEFLPDALEIIESPNSPLGGAIIWMIFIMILLAIVWSYIGRVDMVATARGKIIPNGNVKVVQPIKEGIITSIHVVDGQTVKQGELLLELDTSVEEVDVSTYKKLLDQAIIEKNVLEKIIDGADMESIESSYSDNFEDKKYVIEYYIATRSSFESKLVIYNSQYEQNKLNLLISKAEVKKIEQNISLIQDSINNLLRIIENGSAEKEKLKMLEDNLKNYREELTIKNKLYEAKAISDNELKKKKNEVDSAESEYQIQLKVVEQEEMNNEFKLIDLENNLKLLQSDLLIQTDHVQLVELKINESENNIDNLIQEDRGILLNKLLEKKKEIVNHQAEIEKGEKGINNNHLLAPVDGTVYGLTINTIGGVAKPAESVITIVPDNTELIVEASLMNKDIGFVNEGQEVIVKVDTFPFQKYGALKGTIIHISPNAYMDERQGYIYKVQISIEHPYLKLNEVQFKIVPGMEVSAEIKTGKRRVIDFFLEPLVKYIDESIKLR